jgi:hypothetical protein
VDGIASWLTELAHQVRDAGADGRSLSEVVAAVSVNAR